MPTIDIKLDDVVNFVEVVPVPCMIMYSGTRKILTANKEVARLMGESLGVMEANYIDEREDWLLPTQVKEFEDGKIHSWNSRIKRQDGTIMEARITALPVNVDKQDVVIIILRDRSHEAQEHRYSNLLLGTLARTTHHDFFEYFARSLAQIINMGFVAVCRSLDLSKSETVAYVNDERISDNFTYDLAGSPCELVFGGEIITVPVQAAEKFPVLNDLGFGEVQMYLGVPLIDADGEIVGQIWAMDNSSLHDFNQIVDTMKSYAPLVASELRRRLTEEDSEKMRARLTQAQKLESLGVLAGGIAHDFNNLLTGILGNAELGLSEIPADSTVRQNLEVIRQSAIRAADLCRQMLTYAGQGLKVNVPIAMNKLVTEMVQLLEVSISRKAKLKFDLDENLPMIAGDSSQLSQIVMNLITNASESLDLASGTITLKTGLIYCDREYLSTSLIADQLSQGPYVYLEVSDTGTGMSEQTVERMFDPFYTTKFAGRGLGLSAVLGIVRGHGGALRVTTELQKGTAMRILFPATEMNILQHNEPKSIPANALQGRLIVVADDDETVLATTKAILVSAGAEVRIATGGAEVVSMVQRMYSQEGISVDLVIVDLTMPHMSGIETIEALREVDPLLRAVLSSGYSEEEIPQHYGEEHFRFLQKPFFSQQLIRVVCEALEITQEL